MRDPICLPVAATSIEVWSGLALLGWGAWVFFDPKPLGAFAAYEPIAQNLPDAFWAWVAMVAGGGQIAGRLYGARWARIAGTFPALLMLKIIAVSNMVSAEPGPASMILCAFAFADIAVVIRVAR